MNVNAENGTEMLGASDRSAQRSVAGGGATVPQLKPTVYRPTLAPQPRPMQCC